MKSTPATAIVLAIAACGGCASMSPYAVPDVLPAGQTEWGFTLPIAYSVANQRHVDGAPRPLRDETRLVSALPGVAFVRVGLGRALEMAAQAENGGVAAYLQAQVVKGATNLSIRQGSPLLSASRYGATTQLLASHRFGLLEPVFGAGVGWIEDAQRRDKVGEERALPQGKLGFASTGIRIHVLSWFALQPEMAGFRSSTGDSVGWSAGIAWVFKPPEVDR